MGQRLVHLLVQLDRDEDRHREAEGIFVEQCGMAADDPRLLQPPQAAGGGRGAKTDPACKLVDRPPAILVQGTRDICIEAIQIGGHGRHFPLWWRQPPIMPIRVPETAAKRCMTGHMLRPRQQDHST